MTKRIDKLPGSSANKVGSTRLVTFYKHPPQDEISLDEFEIFAMDRVILLRGIEKIEAKHLDPEPRKKNIDDLQNKHMPMNSTQEMTEAGGLTKDQRKDLFSHFILRIAYCKNEELRRWFINNETILFRHRLERLTSEERQDFMFQNDIRFDRVSYEDKQNRRDKLMAAARITRPEDIRK